MLGTALYYPHIDIDDPAWLRSAILFWDEVQTIVPTSIQSPYGGPDSKICYAEGYLRPLACDMHGDLLEDLGKRVIKLLSQPEWQGELVHNSGPVSMALAHADRLSHEMIWEMENIVGIHPEKMSPTVRNLFVQFGGLTAISEGKFAPTLHHAMRALAYGRAIDPLELERDLQYRHRSYHNEGEWILVNGRFAQVYMSALAALLAKETQISPLTNEEPASGVNLRCLIDDVATSGESAARGALVSVVMEGLRIDPNVSVSRLISFRRGRENQLAELSGQFDDLKGKIEKAADARELQEGAKRLFKNKIRPGLEKLKKELADQSIQSIWDGMQRGVMVSAASSGALAYLTGYTGPMLLGAAAAITIADVGVKSYFSRKKTRISSPYTYLLDIERKFSLPAYS